jgi:electron transfer flavoprotein alpha subunit
MSVLVVMESRGAAWQRMSWETLAAGQQIAAELGVPVRAAVVGSLAAELASKKLERVFQVEHELLSVYTADGYTTAFEALIRETQPSVVLFPHTYQVRDFAPKLATRFGQAFVSDVVRYRVEDGTLTLVRQLFQGKLNADLRYTSPGIRFASLQAGAYRAEAVLEGSAPVERFIPEIAAGAIRNRPREPYRESARAVDLTAAEIIVAVGRGIREQDNIALVETLAQALGAEVGASRPICDNGWLPMERQVGSSGQTVSPKLYFAVGISGAIQHLVGMKGAKTIVAINKDPGAPIFEAADYGIVGDLFEVLPALTEEIKKTKS